MVAFVQAGVFSGRKPRMMTACSGLWVACCKSISRCSAYTCHVTQALLKNYPEGVPLLDPLADMRIGDPGLPAAIERVEALERQLAADPVHQVGEDLCCQSTWHCFPPLRG